MPAGAMYPELGRRLVELRKRGGDMGKIEDIATLAAFGGEVDTHRRAQPEKETKKEKKKPVGGEDLLEGPQKAGEAKTQEEIDALVASSV